MKTFEEYKNFNNIIQIIFKKSPLQKKKILNFISKQNNDYFVKAENFSKNYSKYLNEQNIPLQYAINSYLKMCNNMVASQIFFYKEKKYPNKNAKLALENVYSNEEEMKQYMIGLAISQFLWSTHYEMYLFLQQNIRKYKNSINKYLEIGPGHGLFLTEAIKILGNKVDFSAVDISETSLNITRSIINYLNKGEASVNYFQQDFNSFDQKKEYDFITMGEVLEHVDDPSLILKTFFRLLSKNSRGFISTCVDCPSIDHVYHFTSVQHIRDTLIKNNLIIESEKVLPTENLPMNEIIKKKITINYCAMVKKNEKI